MATIRLSSLAPGISKFSQAIVGGQDAFDAGAEQGATLQGKIAQMRAVTQAQEAAARAHDSTTASNRVKTAQDQIQLDAMQPEALRRTAMIGNGIPLDEAPYVDSWLTTGKLGGKYTTPTDGMGPVAPKPAWAEPSSPFAKQIMAMQNAIALGDKNSENVAKAKGLYENQDRISQAIAGTLDPAKLAAAEYAGKGNAPYHFSEFGVGNNLTGKVDDSGPVAQRFAALSGEKTTTERKQGLAYDASAGASKASAANSYASANQHKAQTAKILKETDQLLSGAKGTIAEPKARFEAENKLRDEFQKNTQNFSLIRDAYGKVLAAATNPNAASDMALIFSYMKILDPTSVVREGEYATAQNAGSLPDKVRNMYNKAVSGNFLTAQQRANFVGEAKKVYSSQEDGLKQTTNNYTEMANRYGLDVRNIVTPYAPVKEPAPVEVDKAGNPVRPGKPDPFNGAPPAGAGWGIQKVG